MLDAIDLLLAEPPSTTCCGGPPAHWLTPTDLARMAACPTHGVHPHPPPQGSARRYRGARRHAHLARRDLTRQQWRTLALAAAAALASATLLAAELGAIR